MSCALVLALPAAAQGNPGDVTVYRGMCDASAAADLGGGRFVAADDEDNLLRIFDRAQPGMPLSQFDLSGFLQVDRGSPETDLEGATRIGDRVYWITSHGRNAEGKDRPNRQRFFATDIAREGDARALVPAGVPCKDLLQALLLDPRLGQFHLDDASRRAPKKEGALNIEGLSAMPDGRLLIGFRNPIPGGKALLVPLKNPGATVQGARPEFDDPHLLDLGGLGIRSIERAGDRYVIIAGPSGEGGPIRLYSWSGGASPPTGLDAAEFSGFTPEALLVTERPDGLACEFLSDDGTIPIDGRPCKRLSDPARKRFRAIRLNIPL